MTVATFTADSIGAVPAVLVTVVAILVCIGLFRIPLEPGSGRARQVASRGAALLFAVIWTGALVVHFIAT